MTTPARTALAAAPSTGRGIALALSAFAMFTVMDTCVKLLGARWHVLQIMAVNSGVALVLVTAVGLWHGGPSRLRSRNLRLHVVRWSVSLVGTIAMFSAYPHVPLADAYGVLFTMPLFLTALSVPLLGEQVGWRRWTAVSVGFLGVLIMLRPGSHGVSPWLFAVLFAAVAHAINMILIRKLGALDAPEAVSFWGNLWTSTLCGATLPWLGLWPTFSEAALGVTAGSIAGTGFLLLVIAYQSAPASIIAPFQYSQLLYGVTAGYFVFAEVPTWNTAAGAAVIVSSGLYILHRETVRARPTVAPPPDPDHAMTAAPAIAVDGGPKASADRPVFGIGAMLLTTFCFTMHDACVKLLAGAWPLTQIMLVIAVTALFALGTLRWREAGFAGLVSRHPKIQLLRAILLPICALGSFWAYTSMPLADAYAINFVQPLVITALSVPLLGEKVGWRRWTAVAVGFVGVLIMLRPGSGLLGPPGLAMLAAACLAAMTIALLRKAPDDPPLVSAIWVVLGMAAVGLVALPVSAAPASPTQLALGVLAGLLAATAFAFQAAALRAARAAVTAPFQYTQILWGLLVGALLFHDPAPDPMTLLGAGIVVASGLYVLHRETRRRRDDA